MRVLLGLVMALLLVAQPVSAASDLVAAVRVARGDSLPTSAELTRIAERRASEIVDDFSHSGFGAPWPSGEILAWNTYPTDLAVAEAIRGWLDSSSHRDILLGDWTHFGAGVNVADGRHFFAVVFARIPPDRAPAVVPTPKANSVPKSAPRPTLPATDTE